jgi:hypothetical protein
MSLPGGTSRGGGSRELGSWRTLLNDGGGLPGSLPPRSASFSVGLLHPPPRVLPSSSPLAMGEGRVGTWQTKLVEHGAVVVRQRGVRVVLRRHVVECG